MKREKLANSHKKTFKLSILSFSVSSDAGGLFSFSFMYTLELTEIMPFYIILKIYYIKCVYVIVNPSAFHRILSEQLLFGFFSIQNLNNWMVIMTVLCQFFVCFFRINLFFSDDKKKYFSLI